MEIFILLVIGGMIWIAVKSNAKNESDRSGIEHYDRFGTTKHKSSQKTFNVSNARRPNSSQKPKIVFGQNQSDANNKTTLTCHQCNKKIRIPKGKSGTVTCPHCSHSFGYSPTTVENQSINLAGINDAFTGIEIDQSKQIYSCECGVFYQAESFELLRDENNSKCVACSKATISLYSATRERTAASNRTRVKSRTKPRNYAPSAVTLDNYKRYVNQVVTFEGYVHKVNVSRRGSDYAVMFENKSWTKGFKLVFFKGSLRKVGGPTFVNSLKGKHIKVRGLLIKHNTFGYEIIINDREMIEEIS